MLIQIKDRALVMISGADAESFLQAQLTNDITLLKNDIQISAFCQHQGKIISLFWLMRFGKGFLLSFPADLTEKVIARLQMFVLMSDVQIDNFSTKYSQIGLINEAVPGAYSINDNLSVLIQSVKDSDKALSANQDEWKKACIDFQIPEVLSITSEMFVPQMLNLDIDEVGVNFSKGCYPGQEVVARLNYLGEAKRRLFAFKSNFEMKVGDSLYCSSSKAAKARGERYKGSGIVVNSVKYNSIFYCLASLDIDLLASNITLNNKHGPMLKIINNE